jgi:hypothetical protein
MIASYEVGVMEYWSVGVMGFGIKAILQYSNIPSLHLSTDTPSPYNT